MEELNYNNETKRHYFLGIMIDKYCNWKGHFNKVCHKIIKFVYVLRTLKNITLLLAQLGKNIRVKNHIHLNIMTTLILCWDNYNLISWCYSKENQRLLHRKMHPDHNGNTPLRILQTIFQKFLDTNPSKSVSLWMR